MIEIFNKLKEYNFWEGEVKKTGFKRVIYLKKIKKYLNNKLIKVLVGQRRVGKSYLMRQIIAELISLDFQVNPKNIFYLNKEIADFSSIDTHQKLLELIKTYKKTLKVKGKIYIFLDEVQEIRSWEKLVNSLSQDYKNEYEVFISGSNSRLLSSELASYISGRYVSFEIFPFLFSEYIELLELEKNKANFLEYLNTGGMPELFNLKDLEVQKHYIQDLKDSILFKDIVQRHKIKNASLLEDIFKFVSNNIGNLFSVNKVVNFLHSEKQKTNHETISNYLAYLKDTFLIHEVDRFDIRGKEILSSTKKYYLNDLSFRNLLSSSFDYEPGNNLENIIYIYFKSLGYKIFVGKVLNTEIDFVLEKDQKKKYVQVIFSLLDKKVRSREFGNLSLIKDNYEKIVISLDDLSFGNRDGIQHQLAWEM